MNSAELKAKWGNLCDTDKLIGQLETYLTTARIRNSRNGICAMLDVFFTNKRSIIEMMRNSDNYTGDLRIMVSTEMTRYGNAQALSNFLYYFPDNVEAVKTIYKDRDSNGKKIADYVTVGKTKVTVDDVINDKINSGLFRTWKTVFDHEGNTRESIQKYTEFANLVSRFRTYQSGVVNNALIDAIHKINENIEVAPGTKTARAFNKVCHVYGVDSVGKETYVKLVSGAKFSDGSEIPNEFFEHHCRVKEVDGDMVKLYSAKKTVDKKYMTNVLYNKLFAEYADMVTDSKRKIKFFISVNPIDYLTMSVGRSWSSCHKLGNSYFGGTVSYMLDGVSIITFVHDDIPNNFMTDGKIYRNMFHYKDGTLLQSRVYPQGNDGCLDLYGEFRDIMHKEIADMLGVKNNWETIKRANLDIVSVGNHYKDYNSWSNTINLTRIPGYSCPVMTIGHTNVCPNCGREEHLSTNRIAHNDCTAAV